MNRNISSGVAMKVVQRLTATAGPLSTLEMYNDNVAPELMERSGGVRYPAVHVYCEKIVNDLAEKFRSFSGSAQMTIELRHSSDKLAGLHRELAELADAATG